MILPLIAFAIELPRHDFSQVSEAQLNLIKTWYWLAIFSRRYSSAAQTYALEDAQALQKAATGDLSGVVSVINRIHPIIQSKDDLLVIHKKYDAVYKGILNLVSYATGGYLNFENGNPVSVAGILEDHHIFPNDYLRKNWAEVHDSLDSIVAIDCVVNRTLIPKLTNVRVSNKPPSKYLSEIKSKNPNILAPLRSHLLTVELLTGDYDKNYDFFLEERAGEILDALRVNVTDVKGAILASYAAENASAATLVSSGTV